MHIHVATSCDRNMEVGLHSMLFTLMRSLAAEATATVHLFHLGFEEQQVLRLHETLKAYKNRYELVLYDIANLDLGPDRKGWFGNRIVYARIVMPEVLDLDEFLFLDADMLVLTDVSKLAGATRESGAIAHVVSFYSVEYMWETERAFMVKMGVPLEAPYFNAGLILFNAKRYRDERFYAQVLEFIGVHAHEMPTADQSVFNVLWYNKVHLLDPRYNRHYFPYDTPLSITDSDCICHFVGSPKPWDFCGEWFHRSYPAFKYYINQTVFRGYHSWIYLNKSMLMRAWSIRRCYGNTLRKRWLWFDKLYQIMRRIF